MKSKKKYTGKKEIIVPKASFKTILFSLSRRSPTVVFVFSLQRVTFTIVYSYTFLYNIFIVDRTNIQTKLKPPSNQTCKLLIEPILKVLYFIWRASGYSWKKLWSFKKRLEKIKDRLSKRKHKSSKTKIKNVGGDSGSYKYNVKKKEILRIN